MSRVDDIDPRFDYKDNAWRVSGQTGEFGGTSHSTSTGGAMVAFGPFTGSSIAVFSTVGTRQTRLHFVVDGGHNSDLPAQENPSVRFQQQVYSVSDLDPNRNHTLNINLLDPGPFTLDFLVIDDSTRPTSESPLSVPQSASSDPVITTSSTKSTTRESVGGTLITSSLVFIASDTITAPTPSSTSISSVTSSSSSSLTLTPATSTGSGPSSNVQNTSSPTATDDSTESSSSVTPMSGAGSSGPNPVVIGSVIGAIAFFAIVVVLVVLLLRRRRQQLIYHGRSIPNNEPGLRDAHSRQRPSLHLSIPSSLSLSRALHRPTLLPTHSNKSLPSFVKQSEQLGGPRPTPSFLAEDPNDSPIFDIKQRPVSGSTVTTRVTVGTTIGQRLSVFDSVYSSPNPNFEAPGAVPVPPIPAFAIHSSKSSPTDTGASSATGSATHLGFGVGIEFGGTNLAGTLDSSVFPGYSENGTAPKGSANSASSRPLPSIPTMDLKRMRVVDVDRELGNYVVPRLPQNHPYNPRQLPNTPSEVETFVHQDAGVRLTSNGHVQPVQPRRELPPPYQDYGF